MKEVPSSRGCFSVFWSLVTPLILFISLRVILVLVIQIEKTSNGEFETMFFILSTKVINRTGS